MQRVRSASPESLFAAELAIFQRRQPQRRGAALAQPGHQHAGVRMHARHPHAMHTALPDGPVLHGSARHPAHSDAASESVRESVRCEDLRLPTLCVLRHPGRTGHVPPLRWRRRL